MTMSKADTLTIRHVDVNGNVTPYKSVKILEGEIFDTSSMSYSGLTDFYGKRLKTLRSRTRCFQCT